MGSTSLRILRALLRCPLTIDDLSGELGAERASVAGAVNALRPLGLLRAINDRRPFRWTATPAGVALVRSSAPFEQMPAF